ncbi:hypothetical protein M5689_000488 [Euphorbia peplus]|nr:hypothetical protein M5689_000488 [Euphorbia peplus]
MDESECLIISGEEEIGDEFYEKIEAPKFVDLTAPDHYQPGDDRSWFCLRVGCDQKHEEEMDSEAIYKNFVLRVMAARSPNVRLRRELCRKNSGLDPKCPRTVPAKPSKSRITRLALISSISKRIVDTKVKVKPLSKSNATPKAKAQRASIIAKALTTPRSKKQLANPEAFRSVRNQKTTANEASDGRVVAKALVFDSPKKGVRRENAVEMNTPLKNLCAGMKKLEITSGKKQVLGYDRPMPSTSRKQFRGREVKSRVFDGLLSQNNKVQHAKASKCLDRDRKANNLQENHDHVHRERVENDVNETGIEEKTTNTSEGLCSITSNGDEIMPRGNLTATETSRPPSDEKIGDALSEVNEKKIEETTTSEGVCSITLIGDENILGGNLTATEISRPPSDVNNEALSSDSNSGDDIVYEFHPPGKIMERDDSEDKENALASDDNRELGVKTVHKEHKILSKHEIPKYNRKTTVAKIKPSKESAPASDGPQSLKLKKPKPTNPKPFRLRTDERGILKEANSEKKQRPMQPLSEITAVPKVAVGNSFEAHHFALLRNAKCMEQNENQQNRTFRLRVAKERTGRKITSTPQRHTISSKQKLVDSQQKSGHHDKFTPKSDNSLRRTKSPSVRQASVAHGMISSVLRTGQLGTIKETSPTVMKATTRKAKESGASSVVTKAYVSPAAASRRSKIIPKEPNFHTMHKPKSCTRRED